MDAVEAGPIPGTADSTSNVTVENHPLLARQRALLAAADAKVDLARSNRVPEPMITARYGYRAELDGVYEAGLSISLPVWMGRRQNAELRSAHEARAGRAHGVEAAELQLGARAEQVSSTVRAARTMYEAYPVSYTHLTLPTN